MYRTARGALNSPATLVLTIVVALAVGPLRAQGPDAPPRSAASQAVSDDEFQLPLDDATAAEIDKLVPSLGSDEFKKREQASERLTEIGVPAFAKLRAAYLESDDLEVLIRIERIVREGYLNRHVFERFGFLGISRKTGPSPTHADDPRIPKGHVGIAIETIIEGTAAERAGLEPDDVIIAKDGTHFRGDALVAFQAFARAIRETGAGGTTSLTVLRGDQVKQIDAVLGRAPRSSTNRIAGLQELYQAASGRLSIWWFKHFRKPRRD